MLAALPEPELQRRLPHLEYVDMRLGEVLYEAGSILSHVYFPTRPEKNRRVGSLAYSVEFPRRQVLGADLAAPVIA